MKEIVNETGKKLNNRVATSVNLLYSENIHYEVGNNMITPKRGFTIEEYKTMLELLAVLSWRLRLTPKPENEKKFRLAVIAIKSVADSNAHNDFLRDVASQLPDFITAANSDPNFAREAVEGDKLMVLLRTCRKQLEASQDGRAFKLFADFTYRFAYKLAGLSGRGFTGMGSNVGAGDAETLLLVRSEFDV